MRIGLGYDIGYRFEQPTPLVVVLSVHDSRSGDLEAPDVPTVTPSVPVSSFTDGFGNRCHRMVAPAGDVLLHGAAVVRDSGEPDVTSRWSTQVAVEDLPGDVLPYLLPSRFCESDRLAETARRLFGRTSRGWPLVRDVADFVHHHVRFDPPAADSGRTAWDTFAEGRGDSRDVAHLGVALCRAMHVPARYCTGYLGQIGVPTTSDPMDFSGWLEVYLSDGWHTVDPHNLLPRIGRVLVARGRDAADVATTTTFGPRTLTRFEVRTDELLDLSAITATPLLGRCSA